MSRVDSMIENIEVQIQESSPPKVDVKVSGHHPDSCDYPVLNEQSRIGSTINIQIYREIPDDEMCPMMMMPYEGTIAVEGDFEAGDYTLVINGNSQDFSID